LIQRSNTGFDGYYSYNYFMLLKYGNNELENIHLV